MSATVRINHWADKLGWILARLFANVQDSRMTDATHDNASLNDAVRDIVDDVRTQGDALLVRVHGEVDLNRSPDLRGHLLRILEEASPTPKRLILNLGDVPYMDSSAVAVLVETLQRMHKQKGVVCLTNVQSRVQGILEIARLETIFKLCTSEEAAMTV